MTARDAPFCKSCENLRVVNDLREDHSHFYRWAFKKGTVAVAKVDFFTVVAMRTPKIRVWKGTLVAEKGGGNAAWE